MKWVSWVGVALKGSLGREVRKRGPKIAILLEVLVAFFCRLRWDLLQALEGSVESLPTECESEREVVGGVGSGGGGVGGLWWRMN